MRTRPALLKQWWELSQNGPLRPIVPGDRVGRGFADLGFEEFLVLDDHRVVSLMTGTISPRQEDESRHLFLVPSVDEALDIAVKGGVDVLTLLCEDNRGWEASVRMFARDATLRGRTLEDIAIAICQFMKEINP